MISIPLVHAVGICLLSGIVSGLAFAWRGLDFGESFRISPFPGLVFGLLFGVVSLRTSELILCFTVLSGIVYYIAVWIAYLVSSRLAFITTLSHKKAGSSQKTDESDGFVELFGDLAKVLEFSANMSRTGISVIAGLLAGGFGSLFLALILKVLLGVALDFKEEAITTLIGSVVGIIFMLVFWNIEELGKRAKSASILMFSIWQLSVGLSLSLGINGKSLANNISPFSENFKAFLQSPVVILIGLIASVIEITLYLRDG
jgi:hypothetical protein